MSWKNPYNKPLTFSESESNAKEIYNFFKMKGFTDLSIYAMLGNMYQESTLNPNVWQGYIDRTETTLLGWGLVQWSPAKKIREYLREKGYSLSSGLGQCERIYDEFLGKYVQWIATNKYPMTFKDFATSNEYTLFQLTEAFFYNYERSSDISSLVKRQNNALFYQSILTGQQVTPPETKRGYTKRELLIFLTTLKKKGRCKW